jgi:hypothetical protein
MTGTSSTEDPLRDALRVAVRDVPVDGELYEKVAEGVRRRARHRVGLAGIAAVAAIIAGAGATVVVADGHDDTVQQLSAMANTTCPPNPENWTRGPQRPGTADVFVPDAPASATVCRYERPGYLRPDPEPAFTLSRRGELSGLGLREVVTAFNAASEHPWRCPYQFDLVELLVRFHYEAGPDVDVIMQTSGCFGSNNGARSATVNLVNIPGFTETPVLLPNESTTAPR